ncbi:MAG: hypothetical protein NTU83_04710 [Candidatus Hydrogenedentes bacterium]|nr:hypothetical protein [Candidatus Hydrogenedentota bacterium]
MASRVRWAFVLLALLGLAARAGAASLKVSPARFIIHDVNPGALYDIYKETGLRIGIFNDDDVSRTWVLSVHRPSERGQWERGYSEIPDARWCWFEQNEVTVAPKERAYANLFLKVPEDEKYLNQHWVVTLGVDGKPGSGGISLAADIRVQIETKSLPDAKQRPDGIFGLAPSIVEFENRTPGSVEKGRVALYNNDAKAHSYSVMPLFDDKSVEQTVYLTHSYSAMPDSGWMAFPRKIDIEPGGVATMDIEMKVPGNASVPGKKWESVLLIKPEEGLAGFVRVRFVTKEAPKTQ